MIGSGVNEKGMSDKVEVTAPVEGATSTAVLLLGHAIAIDGETAFENADKSPRTPFVSAAGDWLRIKARGKGDAIRARTIRVTAPRDQFKVVGEVAAVDETAGAIEIGSLRLPLAQDPDVMLLGGRDPHDPLSLFLADDQKSVPFGIRLGENVRLGGRQASGPLSPRRERTSTMRSAISEEVATPCHSHVACQAAMQA